MFECNLLKTIKDTALQSQHILQVYAPTRCCQLSRIIWETPVLACKASVSVWFRSKERPRNGILSFGLVRNETSTKKGVRGRGRKVSFLYSPPPPHSFAFAILTRVPRSLLLNRTEMLATQATPQFLDCISCSPDQSMKSPGQSPKFTFSCRLELFNREICMCRMSYFTVNMEHFLIKI